MIKKINKIFLDLSWKVKNLVVHWKCFPRLTDFLRIDENLPEIQPFYKFLSKWTFCLLRPFWAKSAAISEFQQNLQMFITQANFHQFQKSWWVLESIFHVQQDYNLSNSSPTIFYWLTEQFIWMYVQNLLNIPFLIIFFKMTIAQLKHLINDSEMCKQHQHLSIRWFFNKFSVFTLVLIWPWPLTLWPWLKVKSNI